MPPNWKLGGASHPPCPPLPTPMTCMYLWCGITPKTTHFIFLASGKAATEPSPEDTVVYEEVQRSVMLIFDKILCLVILDHNSYFSDKSCIPQRQTDTVRIHRLMNVHTFNGTNNNSMTHNFRDTASRP